MNALTEQLKKNFEKRPWATLGVSFGVGVTVGALNWLPVIAVVALKQGRKAVVTSLVSKGAQLLAGS